MGGLYGGMYGYGMPYYGGMWGMGYPMYGMGMPIYGGLGMCVFIAVCIHTLKCFFARKPIFLPSQNVKQVMDFLLSLHIC